MELGSATYDSCHVYGWKHFRVMTVSRLNGSLQLHEGRNWGAWRAGSLAMYCGEMMCDDANGELRRLQ